MALSTISTISSLTNIPSLTSSTYIYTIQNIKRDGNNESFYSSTITPDGNKMYAGNAYTTGFIYTFDATNGWVRLNVISPITPSAQDFRVARNWRSISCDSTGTKLIACVYANFVYISTDSGSNWVNASIEGLVGKNWTGVVCDATFTNLFACSDHGIVYRSSNSGSSWSQVFSGYNLRVVNMSRNGNNIIAARTGYAHISYDGGSTWTVVSTMGVNYIALSGCIDDNGVCYVGLQAGHLIRFANGATTYTTAIAVAGAWNSCSCSADGTIVLACLSGGAYLSTNSGATFTSFQTTLTSQFGTIGNIQTCSISADGSKFIIGTVAGNMITGTLT